MDKKILVVDDERSIATAISYAFKREGYVVETAADGEEALEKAAAFKPDVMILDVMMPRLTGYEVCRKLENRQGLGIILLTVKNDIVDKVLGLELGADDYMTKPFDIRELVARAKALLRRLEKRAETKSKGDILIGKVKLNLIQRTMYVAGELVKLTPKEFDLMALLLSNLERVYTREDLLDLVWGMDYMGGTRTVDIHMQRLRKKVGEAEPYLLQTVYGVGYKATAGIEE
ncbi:DNA-binding response regulator [Priestia aryabhattai]|uniref:response regulator transcription factor n=1 Tax=Bacillaceae TaxID=186817 RepID=UPI000BA16D9A|nr:MULTISPECIES: response regulator transcription factor [Bacillaceae]MDT2046484.1 response regulator transcription factor [Priestia flexa]OZT13785.1 DNA-binding response regulator [Priestia aryabhattai]TDB49839.1 response regulator transcription factor [Bacillus sp. CBEL-1]USY53499.1 response regulator transcription factor [Bacillus sp. 1780r2a1]